MKQLELNETICHGSDRIKNFEEKSFLNERINIFFDSILPHCRK